MTKAKINKQAAKRNSSSAVIKWAGMMNESSEATVIDY
jgi:hypothetical protein